MNGAYTIPVSARTDQSRSYITHPLSRARDNGWAMTRRRRPPNVAYPTAAAANETHDMAKTPDDDTRHALATLVGHRARRLRQTLGKTHPKRMKPVGPIRSRPARVAPPACIRPRQPTASTDAGLQDRHGWGDTRGRNSCTVGRV